ncbi:Fermitin family 2 [Liparis tanakae]|uniref:Fermitin family 2 n=1 Tax=Liparis tanakae TaxID=230148 RepID=A0A4Z2EMC5_9TELE|nr:Fermitin family 2 [Liparis tanakae]
MALDGIRMPDGCYADGTWELKMHVTDLKRDVSLRVTGEIHIGGVMLKLVEKLAATLGECDAAAAVWALSVLNELSAVCLKVLQPPNEKQSSRPSAR